MRISARKNRGNTIRNHFLGDTGQMDAVDSFSEDRYSMRYAVHCRLIALCYSNQSAWAMLGFGGIQFIYFFCNIVFNLIDGGFIPWGFNFG